MAAAGMEAVCRRNLLPLHPQRGPRPRRASKEQKRVNLNSAYKATTLWLMLQALDDARKSAITWHSFSHLCCSFFI